MTSNKDKDLPDKGLSIAQLDIEKLLYIFSHDLRNPLINMRVLASDMQSVLDDAGEETARRDLAENLAMMHDVISHMDGIVSGINDIYHAMFDELECDELDLKVWVKRELAKQQQAFAAKEIEISVGELPTVWVDSLAMQRILKELLDNALHFMPHGGQLSITAEQRSTSAILMVRDNGLGMSESDRQRAFQPFFSSDRKRSGIGLALVKALIQAHGGKVWCESFMDMGSVFYIELANKPNEL